MSDYEADIADARRMLERSETVAPSTVRGLLNALDDARLGAALAFDIRLTLSQFCTSRLMSNVPEVTDADLFAIRDYVDNGCSKEDAENLLGFAEKENEGK